MKWSSVNCHFSFFSFTIAIWASDYARLSKFERWIGQVTFHPTLHTDVSVIIKRDHKGTKVDHTGYSMCRKCEECLNNSELLENVKHFVNWFNIKELNVKKVALA